MNQSRFLLLLFCSVLAVSVAGKTIPVQVREPGMADRKDWPVTGGIPFAKGDLVGKNARLLGADGQPVACQTEVLAKWPDGSTKWLLLDFFVSVQKAQAAAYTLEYGKAIVPAEIQTPLKVTETTDEVMVDTGVLRLAIPKGNGPVVRQIWKSAKPQLARPVELTVVREETPPIPYNAENYVIEADKKLPRSTYLASLGTAQRKVVVEESGPLRATVKISGWHTAADGKKFIPYELRLYAWRGKDWIKLTHTFIYDGEPERDFLREMSIDLPVAAKPGDRLEVACQYTPKPVALGAGQSASLLALGPDKIFHRRSHTNDFSVKEALAVGGVEAGRGADGLGWMSLASKQARITAAVRDWHLLSPKEMLADGDGALRVCLWPRNGDRKLDLRNRISTNDFAVEKAKEVQWKAEKKYELVHNDQLASAVGLAKTHDVFLKFGPAAAPEEILAFNGPMLPFAGGEYNGSTLVNGPFASFDPKHHPALEAVLAFGMRWIMMAQRIFRWDGMLTYGNVLMHFNTASYGGRVPNTWACFGYGGWWNNDGNLSRGYLMMYLRTGRPDYWRFAEAHVRHIMDVNTVHWEPEDPVRRDALRHIDASGRARLGGGHRHNQKVWGDRLCGYGTASNGAGDYYFLTGDRRALDVLKEYVSFHDNGGGSEDEDQLAAIVNLWDATGDPKLLEWGRREFVAPSLKVTDPKYWWGLRRDYILLSLLRYYWSTDDKAVADYLSQPSFTGALDTRYFLFYGAVGNIIENAEERRQILLRSAGGLEYVLWNETPESVESLPLDRMMAMAATYCPWTMHAWNNGCPHYLLALRKAGIPPAAILESIKKK